MIWANLLHLGWNMWGDWDQPGRGEYWSAKPYLRCDEDLWVEVLGAMAAAKLDMVVIDLGEGIRYDSHPELAVEGSWSTDTLRTELKRIRALGLEPIPKLNFSATHDAWLGEYSRRVSTPTYYRVCKDIIAEVAELFDRPRFFHLGMDEETAEVQRHLLYTVVRQFDLWWHDLMVLVDAVDRAGSRPWIWSDHIWYHREEFLNRMPAHVVQSNWYYWDNYHESRDHRVRAWLDLEEHGFDQIPTASTWRYEENLRDMVAYLAGRIDSGRLLGFMQTSWKPTKLEFRNDHMRAIETLVEARDLVDRG